MLQACAARVLKGACVPTAARGGARRCRIGCPLCCWALIVGCGRRGRHLPQTQAYLCLRKAWRNCPRLARARRGLLASSSAVLDDASHDVRRHRRFVDRADEHLPGRFAPFSLDGSMNIAEAVEIKNVLMSLAVRRSWRVCTQWGTIGTRRGYAPSCGIATGSSGFLSATGELFRYSARYANVRHATNSSAHGGRSAVCMV